MSDDGTTEEAEAPAEARPVLRVVDPDATPEEIAAIVAVLASLGGGEAPPAPKRSTWASPARRSRPQLSHGPGAWRTSGLPR